MLAVRHIMETQGVSIVNYIDDLAGAETPEKAARAFKALENMLDRSGLRVSQQSMSACDQD